MTKRPANFNLPPGATTKEVSGDTMHRDEKPVSVTLTRRLDPIKNDWYEWECEGTMTDGSIVDGTVQANGGGNTEMIALETFEEL